MARSPKATSPGRASLQAPLVKVSFTVKHAVPAGYKMCVFGDCAEMGLWSPRLAKVMERANSTKDQDVWEVEVKLRRIEILYRFIIIQPLHFSKPAGLYDDLAVWNLIQAPGLSVLAWESSPVPRYIDLRTDDPKWQKSQARIPLSIFGQINQSMRAGELSHTKGTLHSQTTSPRQETTKPPNQSQGHSPPYPNQGHRASYPNQGQMSHQNQGHALSSASPLHRSRQSLTEDVMFSVPTSNISLPSLAQSRTSVVVDQQQRAAVTSQEWSWGWVSHNVTHVRLSLCGKQPFRFFDGQDDNDVPADASICVTCKLLDYKNMQNIKSAIDQHTTSKHALAQPSSDVNIHKSAIGKVTRRLDVAQVHQRELLQRLSTMTSVPLIAIMPKTKTSTPYMNKHSYPGSFFDPDYKLDSAPATPTDPNPKRPNFGRRSMSRLEYLRASPPFSTRIMTWTLLDTDRLVAEILDENGVVYRQGDFLNFSCDTVSPEHLGFKFSFYRSTEPAAETSLQSPSHHRQRQQFLPSQTSFIGDCIVPPLCMSGQLTKVPIVNSQRHHIGEVTFRYLSVNTIQGEDVGKQVLTAMVRASMVNVATHWVGLRQHQQQQQQQQLQQQQQQQQQHGLHVPVPGLITCMRANTLAALKEAVETDDGCACPQWIQLPVQLTKDKQLVLCDEPSIHVTKGHSCPLRMTGVFQVAVSDWTLDELQALTPPQPPGLRGGRRIRSYPGSETPFPTLKQCSSCLPPFISLYILVSFEGSDESRSQRNKLQLVDELLTRLWADIWPRRAIIASPDPDMCILLRKKQNLFPVIFISSDITKNHPCKDREKQQTTTVSSHADPRCMSFQMAISTAASEHFLGVALPADDLLHSPNAVKVAHQFGLMVVAQSGRNLSCDVIHRLVNSHSVDLVTSDHVMFPPNASVSTCRWQPDLNTDIPVYTVPVGRGSQVDLTRGQGRIMTCLRVKAVS